MKTSFSAAIIACFLLVSNFSFAQYQHASYVQGSKSYVQIDWSLTNSDLSHFVIERSLDGETFKQYALVFASEDASFSDYKFRDKEIVESKIIYYRIGAVNNQKEVTYFPVRKVVINKQEESVVVNAYPNPVQQEVRINLPETWKSKNVEIKIFTLDGNNVKSSNVREAGSSELVSVQQLPAGRYILKAFCEMQAIETVLIKK